MSRPDDGLGVIDDDLPGLPMAVAMALGSGAMLLGVVATVWAALWLVG